MSAPETQPKRPGRMVRAAAGAWHVPAAFVFLLRRPRLWPLTVLPTLLTMVGIVAGVILGVFTLRRVDSAFASTLAGLPELLGVIITLGLWVGTMAACVVLGFAMALFFAAPILEALARRVEREMAPDLEVTDRGLLWETLQALRGALYFLAAAPIVFGLSLIPLIGPGLGALWGAYRLSHQVTEVPLNRHGLDFDQRRTWHRAWRAESIGLGLAGVAFLLIPVLDLLLAPVLMVAGTLLVTELGTAAAPVSSSPARQEPADHQGTDASAAT